MSNRDLSKSTATGFSTVVPKNKSRRRDNRLSQSLGTFGRAELANANQPWNAKSSLGTDVEKRAEYLLRDVRQLALPKPYQGSAEGFYHCKIPYYIYAPDQTDRGKGMEKGKIIKIRRGIATEFMSDADMPYEKYGVVYTKASGWMKRVWSASDLW